MSTAPRPPLPAAGRAIVGVVGVSGFAVAIHAVAAQWGTDIPIEWIAFSLLTFASGLFTLKIPSIDALLSVSEIFAFSCVLLFGPELGALTVTIDALLLSLRRKHGAGLHGLQRRQSDTLGLVVRLAVLSRRRRCAAV